MLNFITGDPATTTLRQLILNLVVFVGVAVAFYFLINDAVLGLGWGNLVFDVGVFLSFGLLYWLTRFRARYRLVTHLGTLIAFSFFTASYFFNGGVEGPTLFAVLMLMTFITILHSPRASWIYLALSVLLVLAMLAAGRLAPGLILPYRDEGVRYLDVTLTFFCCLLMTFFVMRMVMRFFQETMERSRAEQVALLQSEKMASLGEILANMSHEISTPVGVIGSSLSFSQDWWTQVLPQIPRVLNQLPPEQVAAFWELLAVGLQNAGGEPVDSRTARARRQELTRQLASWGLPDSQTAADDLVTLGWWPWNTRWETLMVSERGREAFSVLLHSLTLDRANRNAAVAYEKIRNLLKALVSYSRSEVPDERPVPTVVSEGIETVLTLYATPHRATLEVVRDFHPAPKVLARPDELIQVWTNLVQNAIQAMDGKGVLTVTVEPSGTWVEVVVTDTGPGVPLAIREKIFTPFFTTKERGSGTGLGLGIVSRVVSAHGGQVALREAAGGGAEFVVRLPVAPTSPSA